MEQEQNYREIGEKEGKELRVVIPVNPKSYKEFSEAVTLYNCYDLD
jgi:hypothetical protein